MNGVIRNISLLYSCGDGDRKQPIPNGAVVFEGGKITWVGPEGELPQSLPAGNSIDAGGKLLVPGLIDCHTHLAFAGWRADEFERRVRGESYLEIAKAGGGILSTVKKTRAATEEDLFDRCLGFLSEIKALGVTTVECKSGYGLSLEEELKLLRVYKRLSRSQPLGVISTLMAAHTVPPEFKDNREGYLSLITEKIIPAVVKDKLATFCDIFVEDSAFSPDEARRILGAGKKAGLIPKLHVDQITDLEGGALAAELGAVSADHLEKINDAGIKELKRAGVVAVLLPLASLYTHHTPVDGRRLLEAGVDVAVATDFNPGSAPSFDIQLAMMLGCNLNRLTPEQALRGVTINAARALNLADTHGSIEVGKVADFAVIDAPDVNHWLYHMNGNRCAMTVKSGDVIWSC